MTSRNKTTITAEPGSQELFITREFDAPRPAIFKAFTDPQLFVCWNGPRGHTTRIEAFNPVSGGCYRYFSVDEGGNEYAFNGAFHEVSIERIIQTFEFEGLPERGHVSLDSMELLELPGGRTRLVGQSVFRSVADRDGILQAGMETGVVDSYDRLDEVLAGKRDLVVRRVFNAPVEQVWKAWTEAEYVMRWWGPDHFTCPSARMDVRLGGTSIVCMRAPQDFGGQDSYSTWTYTRIEPLRRLEYIQNLSDEHGNPIDPVAAGFPPEFPRDTLTVVLFKDLGGSRTELTVTEYAMPPADTQIGQYAELGLNQTVDKIAAIFAG